MSKVILSNETVCRLKDEIRNSSVFTFPVKVGAAYEKARSELIEKVYLLTLSGRKTSPENFDYNLEFIERIDCCIRNFKPENGDFLHYFNFSLKGGAMNADARERRKRLNTIGMSEEDSSDDFTPDEVLDYFAFQNGAEDEDCSFIENLMSEYNIPSILDSITRAYYRQQKRTRPLFSAYVTGALYDGLDECLFRKFNIRELPYFDEMIYDLADKDNESCSNAELARIFGQRECNISRSIRIFKEAIRNEFGVDDAA